MGEKYDFSGWATKNNLECSDGRIIKQDAFKECDGKKVPLVYMHDHSNPDNILGYCILKNKPEGVKAYGFLNNTAKGNDMRERLRHGDVDSLSIWANHLTQSGNSDGSVNVIHGAIKEVSLVLSGANPGATIDTVVMAHSGETSEDDIIIMPGFEVDLDDELEHSDDEETDEGEKTMTEQDVKDVFNKMSEEQKEAVYAMVGMAIDDATEDDEVEDIEDEEDEEDVEEEEIDDTEDDADDGDGEGEAVAQSDFNEGDEMKYNVFDEETNGSNNVMSQADMEDIFKEAKRCGSLKEAVLAHDDESETTTTVTYGIDGMQDVLFPDAKLAGDNPNIISRNMTWVGQFINACHHSPFSRVKSIAADLTADEARAKGYIKAHQKTEEVISMFKRKVEPQTIYKKQKFDRDDLIDITDFNVIAFIKTEMRQMLEEEIARAGLVGDGRIDSSEDKINETHIIPIYKDSSVYSVKVKVDVAHGALGNDKAKEFIDACVRARKQYKGSGNPTAYMTEDMLTECLLLEDGIGHKMYKSEAEVATALRVAKIVTVPVMENITDTTYGDLAAIIVNPVDYTFGADKGGEINMFDDFDIDYNQQKYLMETRISGALTKPYSALVVSIKEAAA